MGMELETFETCRFRFEHIAYRGDTTRREVLETREFSKVNY